MSSSIIRSSSSRCGPWRLIRIALRTLFFGTLTWFILALLWAFLPSPISEHDGDQGSYATTVLKFGARFTRVYDSELLRMNHNRRGFALEYKLDANTHTLYIGENVTIDIAALSSKWADAGEQHITGDIEDRVNVLARVGDTDGANLPWFTFADSVLLFWWIHKETMTLELLLQWKDVSQVIRRLEVYAAASPRVDPLLSIEVAEANPASIVLRVPEMPLSSSPSTTYPIRIAIIHIIAPIAVFVNDLLGNTVGFIISSVLEALVYIFAVFLYGCLAFAIVFSLWRCLRGPSFEDTVDRVRSRLGTLSNDQRLHMLRLDVLREILEHLCRNEKLKAVLDVCRNGWHPERNAAVAAERALDLEKGENLKAECLEAEKRDLPSK